MMLEHHYLVQQGARTHRRNRPTNIRSMLLLRHLALCLLLFCLDTGEGQTVLVGEEVISPNGESDGVRKSRRRRLLLQRKQQQQQQLPHHEAEATTSNAKNSPLAVVAAVALSGNNTTCGGVLVAPDVILTVRGLCEFEWRQGARIVLINHQQHQRQQHLLDENLGTVLRGVQALYGHPEEGNSLMLVHLSHPVEEADAISYFLDIDSGLDKQQQQQQHDQHDHESPAPTLYMLLVDASDSDKSSVVLARLVKTVQNDVTKSLQEHQHHEKGRNNIFSTKITALRNSGCQGAIRGGGWPIVTTSTKNENRSSPSTRQHRLVGLVSSWSREDEGGDDGQAAGNACMTDNVLVTPDATWIRESVCCISNVVGNQDEFCQQPQRHNHHESCHSALLWTIEHGATLQEPRQLLSDTLAPSAIPGEGITPAPTHHAEEQNPAPVLEGVKAVSISSPEEGTPVVIVSPSPSGGEPVARRDVATTPDFAGGVSTVPNGESIAPSTLPTREKRNPTATAKASPTRPPILGVFDPKLTAGPVTASPTRITGDHASPSVGPVVDMTLIPTVASSTDMERPNTSPAKETLNPTADYNTTGARRVEGTANLTHGVNGAPILKSVGHNVSSAISAPAPTPVHKAQPTRPPFLLGLLPAPTFTPITDISTIQPASTNTVPSPTSVTGEPTVSASPVGKTAGPTQMDSLQGPSFSPAPTWELSGFPNPTAASLPTTSPAPDRSPVPTPVQGAPQRPPFFDGFFDPSSSPTFAPSSSVFPSNAGGGHDTLQPATVDTTPSTEPSTPAFQFLLPSKECAPDLACPWIKNFPGYQLYIVKNGVCIERCQWEERLSIFKLVGWKCGYCP